jgi:adenylate kinase family enzyme
MGGIPPVTHAPCVSKMRKVMVIGSAGAGKSTFSTRLGKILELPVYHLDSIFWRPGWVRPEREVWTQAQEALVAGDEWILDGNYGSTLEIRVRACDTVIFLAFPRLVCLGRVIKRWLRYRGRTRPDLNPGCVEHMPDREFLSWIWGFPKRKAPGVFALLEQYREGRQVFVIESPRALEHFARKLEGSARRRRLEEEGMDVG